MTRWDDLTTFGLRHWTETAESTWQPGRMVQRSHPTEDEVRAALPSDIRERFEHAYRLNHDDAPQTDDIDWHYGHWSGTDPREWCPDLESNTEQEIRHWAAACALYDQGDALRPEATYPNHPLGCTRDERFGLGSWWRRLSPEEAAIMRAEQQP